MVDFESLKPIQGPFLHHNNYFFVGTHLRIAHRMQSSDVKTEFTIDHFGFEIPRKDLTITSGKYIGNYEGLMCTDNLIRGSIQVIVGRFEVESPSNKRKNPFFQNYFWPQGGTKSLFC